MREKNAHLRPEDRRIIKHCLSNKEKLIDIASAIGCDPTTISKEIRRNRVIYKEGRNKEKCKSLIRFPYTCNHCPLKYGSCTLTTYIYDNEKAQYKADSLLISSRKGLDITKEEFEYIDKKIKYGIDNKDSIYNIVKSDDSITVSVPTIYRWISNNLMTVKKHNLPYAVTYKVRKKDKEKYDYSSKNNKIDRNNRTFIDYLSFRMNFPGLYASQIDFLGTIKSDSKDILSLIIPELHFPILKLFDKPDQNKLKEFIDSLEKALGLRDFYKIFPAILGDRDPIFNDFESIERSCLGDKDDIRCLMFYCDPYQSSQKPYVENINKQLRKYFPKGYSIDRFTDDEIKTINIILLERKVASLGGLSPKEAFIKIYGKEIYEKLIEAL